MKLKTILSKHMVHASSQNGKVCASATCYICKVPLSYKANTGSLRDGNQLGASIGNDLNVELYPIKFTHYNDVHFHNQGHIYKHK